MHVPALPPQTHFDRSTDWERKRAYEACLKAEQSLEMAGLEYEARQIRKIRLYSVAATRAEA